MDPAERARAIERERMVGRSALRASATVLAGAVFAGLVLAACTDPLKSPPCTTPAAVDTASIEGDTITTTTGLRFIDSLPGSGVALRWCNTVAVHYTGYLLDGTKFDSSRDIDRPLTFTPGVGTLIDGFEQGVIGMRTGGKRLLIIPPTLGYGAEPVRDETGAIIIPPNSTLVFEVEVLGIAT